VSASAPTGLDAMRKPHPRDRHRSWRDQDPAGDRVKGTESRRGLLPDRQNR